MAKVKKVRTTKRRERRIGVWKKNGKGPGYASQYVYDAKGDRHVVLTTILGNGNVKTVKAESPKMLRAAGWKRVAGKGIQK